MSPIISAAQLLTWAEAARRVVVRQPQLDRLGTDIHGHVGTGANNLGAMVPLPVPVAGVIDHQRVGDGVFFTLQTIKGIEYAVFNAAAGSYTASYSAASGAPFIAAAESSMASDGTATLAWTTDEPATGEVFLGTRTDCLTSMTAEAGTAGDDEVVLDDLQPGGPTTTGFRLAPQRQPHRVAGELGACRQASRARGRFHGFAVQKVEVSPCRRHGRRRCAPPTRLTRQ